MGHEPLAKLRLNPLQSESLLFCAHPLQLGSIYNHQCQYVPSTRLNATFRLNTRYHHGVFLELCSLNIMFWRRDNKRVLVED